MINKDDFLALVLFPCVVPGCWIHGSTPRQTSWAGLHQLGVSLVLTTPGLTTPGRNLAF
jgi:hypothetical protein